MSENQRKISIRKDNTFKENWQAIFCLKFKLKIIRININNLINLPGIFPCFVSKNQEDFG